MTKVHPAARTTSFTESVIREMTRLAMEHDAVNLSQGFPDFPAPEEVKRAAKDAIDADLNQYPITWGEPEFRGAIAAHYERWYGMEVDQHRQLVVTCGSTEAMMASLLGIIDPGDEVVIFEPYYENYGPDTILSGAVPRYVPLRQPDWTFDEGELAAAFGPRTRGIVVNTPNNPTGKVFSRQELEAIARLCQEWDVIAFTDEIYEHITYDGTVHVPIATIDGMQDRTVTISALSKTYAVTGWRVGWAIAPESLVGAIRKVHDFLSVGAPTPLQHAGATALSLPDAYYARTAEEYAERRELMMKTLWDHGFEAAPPKGAYYVMAGIGHLGLGDDTATAHHLTTQVGVAVVPGSSFYAEPERGHGLVRFSFSKRLETLREAASRLEKLRT
ncbi:MAG TPA: aminotransferase class I/II-fold pyridoxal phosphate-dependent enzyme [Actinomycetota bacterium]|nr:aminotransferase class I/II-fold pyridoxal phosphate-dependent enzyme [Actinomycetota bacterium]